ncbi:MAG: helix-turn-helix domain-containing protein, partial [Pseudomonadota bacterium]
MQEHQERTSDETLDRIMTTAYEEFARLGYHGVKVSRLCEAANIANGTFYIYFRNKDELYKAVVGQAITTLMNQIGPRNRR